MHHTQTLVRWAAVLTIAALVACSPRGPSEIPTVAVMPSDTATSTPSITPTPSNTPTPSHTPTVTPTFTPSSTWTPSLTKTLTPTRTFTETPTPTETFTLTPTPTLSETPIPTETPTVPPTVAPTETLTPTVGPAISLFTVEPGAAISGGVVIARWQADGDTITIDLLTENNALIQTVPVEAKGERSFTVSSAQGNLITFRLTAMRGGKSEVRTATVAVQCAQPWFFSPPQPGCPLQAAQSGAVVFQAFERGIVFYVSTNNTVYVLANEGTRVNAYPNEWAPGVLLPVATPPAGFFNPTAQIGHVWYNKQWNDGRSVGSVIGWPIINTQNYNGTIQAGNPASDIYINRPDGAVYKMALAGTGIWSATSSSKLP